MPVDALIAPAKLTVKALAPTANGAVGAQVAMPILPLVITKAPWAVVVPMPTLPFNIATPVPAAGVVHVPMPTGPRMASLVCGVVVPTPKFPLTLVSPVCVKVPVTVKLSAAASPNHTLPSTSRLPLTYRSVLLEGLLKVPRPIRTSPLISSRSLGLLEPIPTLPPVNKAEYVALENVGVPVKVLADVPLWV